MMAPWGDLWKHDVTIRIRNGCQMRESYNGDALTNSFLLILHRGSVTLFIHLSSFFTRCDFYEASRRMEGSVTNCSIYVSIHNFACLVAQGRAGYFTRTAFGECWKLANILVRDVFSYLLWGEMLR